jgi:cellulose synthase/poly-beta-1,6-N-acetylglucosamine synthase-like glycosyltransferase
MAMSFPRYSVIVPAYQEAAHIGACVRALVDQTVARSAYEIVVVDDASTDATAAIAKESGADLVVTVPHGGVAAARNAGIVHASGEIVLFTDADCTPCRDWIARIVDPFEDGDVVGVKGTYRTQQPGLIARLVQLEFEVRYERMASLSQIDFIDTYAAAYRKSVLHQEGGFDTDYPVPSAEDVDLSFRLAKKGYRMVFAPDAWVWHVHPSDLVSYLKRKMRFGYWRALLYLHFPDKISGDAHTDPLLKPQFALVALSILMGLGALVWSLLWFGVLLMLLAFLMTTLPFVRWAWSRDRQVALAWPAVAFLRVVLQGMALGWGLVSQIVRRRDN